MSCWALIRANRDALSPLFQHSGCSWDTKGTLGLSVGRPLWDRFAIDLRCTRGASLLLRSGPRMARSAPSGMHWNSGIKPFLKERSHKYSQTTQFLHFPAIPRRRYELDQVKGNHQQGDLIQVEAMEGRGFTLFSCFGVRPPAGRGWQRAGISCP
jgi:hypothetical protein